MNIVEMIRYLNSEDGPNIPLRTLGTYCGCTHAALSNYLNGKIYPNEKMRK